MIGGSVVYSAVLSGHGLLPLHWGVAIGASLIAAIYDVSTRRVPNGLTVPVVVTGLVWAVSNRGLGGLGDAAGGCVLLALPYVLLFVFAGGGAGDAKLMGAIGAWLGLREGLVVLISVVVVGAALAVVLALAKGRGRSVAANLSRVGSAVFFVVFVEGSLREVRSFMPRTKDMQTIPYGLAVFGGVCAAAGGLILWPV